MNALKKRRIKTTMKYTWPFYIIATIIIIIIMNLIFGVIHRLPAYKTLTLFVSGEVTNSNKLRKDLLAKYEDKELKSVSSFAIKPSDGYYMTKLTVIGYNDTDILIIPLSKLNNLKVETFALELNEQIVTSYYESYAFYTKEETNYGIKLNKEKVNDYMKLPEEDCYLFLNGGSQIIGEYGIKNPHKDHNVALELVKEWGI